MPAALQHQLVEETFALEPFLGCGAGLSLLVALDTGPKSDQVLRRQRGRDFVQDGGELIAVDVRVEKRDYVLGRIQVLAVVQDTEILCVQRRQRVP